MSKDGMMDNRKVNDNHQQGIERVKGASKLLKKGQGGKMSNKGSASWRRSSSTPKKA